MGIEKMKLSELRMNWLTSFVETNGFELLQELMLSMSKSSKTKSVDEYLKVKIEREFAN